MQLGLDSGMDQTLPKALHHSRHIVGGLSKCPAAVHLLYALVEMA